MTTTNPLAASVPDQVPAGRPPRRVRPAESAPTVRGLVVKLALLAVVTALGVFLAFGLFSSGQSLVGLAALALVVLVDVTYLRRGGLAAKYLLPGLVLLVVFQVFVVAYTVAIAFTNYGDGHNVSKADAVATIVANSAKRVPGSPAYTIKVVERDGVLGLLATDSAGRALLGTASRPLAPAPGATIQSGQAVAVPGYHTLSLAELLGRQAAVTQLSVPFAADPTEGYLRTADGLNGYVYKSTLVRRGADLVDTATGTVYRDDGRGNFAAPDGTVLQPGWKAQVGLANFTAALGSAAHGALVGVVVWTIVFAAASVVLTFALGTFLALVFNDPRMRGRRIYRVLMILPYAFPVFLTGLVWSGLLNTQYGFVNAVLLRGAEVPWLQDPILARISVILVSVWFGFPYFFLVSTGALQAIPEDIQQAARVDGAGAWQLFRHIKLPLLLVSTSPLLIAAFAFSFNDFNTIFMLTGGGPSDATSTINAGSTDILITVVYKQAFLPNSAHYGLASAFSVLIFVIVALISIVLFRRTRSLEEVYR